MTTKLLSIITGIAVFVGVIVGLGFLIVFIDDILGNYFEIEKDIWILTTIGVGCFIVIVIYNRQEAQQLRQRLQELPPEKNAHDDPYLDNAITREFAMNQPYQPVSFIDSVGLSISYICAISLFFISLYIVGKILYILESFGIERWTAFIAILLLACAIPSLIKKLTRRHSTKIETLPPGRAHDLTAADDTRH